VRVVVSSPFRRPAVETQLVVPSAEATRLLLELAREGWRVVGAEGAGWRLERPLRDD
jgi:hypothetical protein